MTNLEEIPSFSHLKPSQIWLVKTREMCRFVKPHSLLMSISLGAIDLVDLTLLQRKTSADRQDLGGRKSRHHNTNSPEATLPMIAERVRLCGIELHFAVDMGRTTGIIELETRGSSGSSPVTVVGSRVKDLLVHIHNWASRHGRPARVDMDFYSCD